MHNVILLQTPGKKRKFETVSEDGDLPSKCPKPTKYMIKPYQVYDQYLPNIWSIPTKYMMKAYWVNVLGPYKVVLCDEDI